jgi:hypothetical protein
LGTDRNLVSGADGYSWSDGVPRHAWHLTGALKSSGKCLDTLLKLEGAVLPTPPQKYLTAFAGLTKEPVRWQHALPEAAFREYFKNLVGVTSSIFPKLSFDYYERAWAAGSRVLSQLRPAKINVEMWRELSESTGQSSVGMDGFKPNKSGFAALPVYDRFGTRTGRLTIASGPNILNLRRESRAVIKSAFEGGSICCLDFKALEPRIVLAEAGKATAAEDLYAEVAQEMFGGAVSRDTVKSAVISMLYGIGRASLMIQLHADDSKIDAFMARIREYFGLTALADKIRKGMGDDNIVVNRYGRRLKVDADARDAILINTYAQSSGVDVVLLGFDRILTHLGTDGIRPLFSLVDAIILDVSPDRLRDVQSVTSIDVPTYSARFPLKFEVITKSIVDNT